MDTYNVYMYGNSSDSYEALSEGFDSVVVFKHRDYGIFEIRDLDFETRYSYFRNNDISILEF